MSKAQKNWGRVLDAKRIKLCGKDAKLEFLDNDSSVLKTLTDSWCPRQQGVGDGHEWDIDFWLVKWADIQFAAKAKLYAHGEVITFRIEENSRRIIGGPVFRLQLHVIGDQR
jgi:hypothetical protein